MRSRRRHAEGLAPFCRGNHADADRLAMQQHAVTHAVFQRVRQRMPIVELHADAVVVRILLHIPRLDFTAAGDDLVKLRHQRLAAPQRLYALKKRRVGDAAILDDLAQARSGW